MDTTPTSDVASTIIWGPCREVGFERGQCATFKVPLDPEEPEGPAINIALFQVPTLLPRVATILINPGGPESSGVEFARDSADMFPDEFDVAAPNTMSAYHHSSRSST